jgi:hypothetical protein
VIGPEDEPVVGVGVVLGGLVVVGRGVGLVVTGAIVVEGGVV